MSVFTRIKLCLFLAALVAVGVLVGALRMEYKKRKVAEARERVLREMSELRAKRRAETAVVTHVEETTIAAAEAKHEPVIEALEEREEKLDEADTDETVEEMNEWIRSQEP